jgi:hypothetical protein
MIRNFSQSLVPSLFVPICALLISGCYDSGSKADGDGAEDVIAEPDSGDTAGEEPTSEWTACAVPSDCVFVSKGCCSPCGIPSLDDYDVINRVYVEEHHTDVCPDPIPCPNCATEPNPELVATCIDGRCTGMDIGTEDFSACTADDECVIRVPDCCECGADTSHSNLIAFRVDAWSTFMQIVCDPMVDCPMCEPIYPVDAEPFCDTDGHCAVRFIPTP